MIPTIETERLWLRKLQPTDAEQLHTIFSNIDVLRHYGMEPHESLEQTEQMLAGMLEGISDGSIMRWGIVRKDQPELIGAVVYTENVASQQLLEHNGFVREGLLQRYMRQENEAHDVYVYGYIAQKEGPQCKL